MLTLEKCDAISAVDTSSKGGTETECVDFHRVYGFGLVHGCMHRMTGHTKGEAVTLRSGVGAFLHEEFEAKGLYLKKYT